MVGLFFIYFIGKAFYKLAEEFEKMKWLYAILGVLSYYVGPAILGIVLAIFYELQGLDIETLSEGMLTILSIVTGGLSCWGFYAFLKYQWGKIPAFKQSDILDDEFL